MDNEVQRRRTEDRIRKRNTEYGGGTQKAEEDYKMGNFIDQNIFLVNVILFIIVILS